MTDQELEGHLRAWYRAQVGENETAPVSLRREVAAIPRTVSRPARRFGGGRGITLLAAVALLLVGGAAAVGSGLLRLPSVVPPEPVPSLAVVPTPSPAAESPSPAIMSSHTPRMPGWSAGGSMIEARSGHTATLLPDGRVLVAGGDNANGMSAELYDPGSRSWTATGSTATPFANGTATLLHDSRVLLTGGVTYDATAPNNWRFVAEMYDPGSGSWAAAGDGFKGGLPTLLPDGTVLMAGVGNDGRAAQVYDPSSGTWTATGSMVTDSGGNTATLLHDGRVLVSGTAEAPGCVSLTCPSVSVVQLYDPGTGSWTTTEGMATPRTLDTATLLSDGRVLVAGGRSTPNQNPLASAELYDPVAGTWTAAGKMATPRSQHTATQLPDGRVLVAGGMSSSSSTSYLASAELYDPVAGTWTAAGKMATPREGSTATLLSDGTVLVAGGMGAGTGPLASTELYDPGTGTPPNSGPSPAPSPSVSPTVSPAASVGPTPTPTPGVTPGPGTMGGPSAGAPAWTLTGNMVITRSHFTATLLPDGRVVAAGGAGLIADLASAELYDPASGTWTATGSMNTPREGNTATLLRDGEVLVAGGGNNGTMLASAELYDPASGTWTATGKMHAPRAGHTATLLPDGRVLVAGGMGNSTSTGPDYLASAELYDPATVSWTAAGKMATARSGSTATLLPDGRVLVVGGNSDREGGPAAGELYDPHSGSWTATRNLVMRRPVNTATLLPNGTVLVAGGSGTSAELYIPATGSWRATGSMGTARDYDTMATLLPDGRVLVLGGDYNSGGNGTSAELYNPSRGTWTATPKMLIAGSTATLLPDGTVLVAGHGATWSPPGSAELYDSGSPGRATASPNHGAATRPLIPGPDAYCDGAGVNSVLLATTDGGQTWTPIGS